MKNLHLIPTDKPSKLVKNNLGIAINEDFTKSMLGLIQAKFINLYITNSEEIKEGDWFYDTYCNVVSKLTVHGKDNRISAFKKIILTTDQDLIKDGVQSIDDEFLEWFVKNPSCEEIETIIVSTWCNDGKVCVCNVPKFCNEKRNGFKYKIIIPNENWLLNNPQCKQIESCSKSLSKKCICPKEEPKQETLEEAIERFLNGEYLIPISSKDKVITKQMLIDGANNYFSWGFLEAVKWQQEQDKKCYHPMTERKHTSAVHFDCTICGYNNY